MASSNPPGLLGDLQAEDLNDACCWACSGGGDVVCCDGCRAVYHLACIGLNQLPEDDWFCPLCHCKECSQPCRSQDGPLHIGTKFVEVQQKPLQPRLQPHQRLPTCPGYLCPQQVRQWLQNQPAAADAAGSTAAAGQDSSAKEEEEEVPASQPRAKRQKAGDTGSSSGSVSPSGNSGSSFVRCCSCQAACHITCLPAALRKQYIQPPSTPTPTKSGRSGGKGSKKKVSQQAQTQQTQTQPVEPYFCSPACQQVATHMANRCAQGVMQVDALTDGTPVSWQLIQPAAVAAALAPPADSTTTIAAAAAAVAAAFGQSSSPGPAVAAVGLLGTGVAAGYSRPQAEVLAQVLRDALALMAGALGPAWEVRSFQDTLPWLLGSLRASTPGGLLDLSHFHLAVLWVGSTLAAAALVRLHGTAVLEVSLVATLQQLQHKQLGRLLVACVERFALETCKVKQAWMPALGGVVKPCVGVSVLPSWERPAGARDPLQPAAGSSVQLLGLGAVKLESPAAAAGTSSDAQQQRQQQQQAAAAAAIQQQHPKDLKSCWALQLKYGPAPTVVDWLQLPKHMLLRFSYVPFVTKRLSPETLVPLPRFSQKRAKAGPASAEGGSPPGAAAAAGAGGTAAAARGGSSNGGGGGGGTGQGRGRTPPGPAGAVARMASTSAVAEAARHQQQQQLLQQQEIVARQQREHQRQQQLLLEQQRHIAEQQMLQQQQQQWLLQTQQHVQQLQQQRKQQEQVLRPHLQQLPPRGNNNSQVLGQQQQQLQQQEQEAMEKQQSLVPPATPGIAAGIAAGIVAYNSSASRVGGVVGVSGVGARHAGAPPEVPAATGAAHMHWQH